MLIAVVLLVALNVTTLVLSYLERTRMLNAVIAKNSLEFKKLENEPETKRPVRVPDPNEMIFGL